MSKMKTKGKAKAAVKHKKVVKKTMTPKTAKKKTVNKRAQAVAQAVARVKAKLQKEMRKPRLLETPPTTDAPPPMQDSRPTPVPMHIQRQREHEANVQDAIQEDEEIGERIAAEKYAYRFVPGIPPVALHITPPDPALPQDGTLVRGQLCTWWGDMALTGTDPAGNAVCPQCGKGLQYLPDRAGVEAAAAAFEAGQYPHRNVEQGALPKLHPGYFAFVRWMEGKCFPNITDAAATYVLASGIVVDPQP